jgi:hypothetical protein
VDPGIDGIRLAEKDKKEADGNTRPYAGVSDTEVKAHGSGQAPEDNPDEFKLIDLGEKLNELFHTQPPITL